VALTVLVASLKQLAGFFGKFFNVVHGDRAHFERRCCGQNVNRKNQKFSASGGLLRAMLPQAKR
jgi:hypothetical protein